MSEPRQIGSFQCGEKVALLLIKLLSLSLRGQPASKRSLFLPLVPQCLEYIVNTEIFSQLMLNMHPYVLPD